MATALSRRSFVQWSAAAASMAGIAGLTGCATANVSSTSGETEQKPQGEWKTGACMYNCSCEASRCLLRVYVEDGVPLAIESDYYDEDSVETPQRRACARGYAQISNMLSPARIKYPMKRKGWSPENPNGQMRGKDEWERISWEEALSIVAEQTKKIYEKYGPRGILIPAFVYNVWFYFDASVSNFFAMGGAVVASFGSCSKGSWQAPSIFMTGMRYAAPDMLSVMKSDLHIMFGCNWAHNKAGNITFQIQQAKENGAEIICIDPWLNPTAQAIADEWIPIKPGTDTAFILGACYHQIQNNLFDQAYLDKYCSGFDAEHMPEGAPKEENFKDYVLGTYDGQPKTPEWAEKISGVPASKIREFAEKIHATKNVNFFAGQSTSKIPAGEMICQAFYTLALMHGGIGAEGNYMSWIGHNEHGWSAARYASAGDACNPLKQNLPNSLDPAWLANTIDFKAIKDNSAWDALELSELWQSVLDGEYGRDIWPGGKRKLDVHMIYAGGWGNFLNSMPNTNAAIEAFRRMDFVVVGDPYFSPTAQHADIILPIASRWEKGNTAWQSTSDTVYWADKVLEPLFESRSETLIATQLAEALGLNAKEVNPLTDEERTYYSLKDMTYLKDVATKESAPVLTITKEDLAEIGVEGETQEGIMSVSDFIKKGFYKVERKQGDPLTYFPFKDFYDDPVNAPLATTSGKFEIYSPALATFVNDIGFSTIAPIAKWQYNEKQGVGAQTDEFPLLLWTPHSLRRAHTCNDTSLSLREAFPQECFMSPVDAEARGIKSGDTVLMTSPHGKVLRPAKVLATVAPGAVALQDGAWTQIDEETGIDLGGNPNILQAPAASGHGAQVWTGTIVQVEKYTGKLELAPDKLRPVASPDAFIKE